VLSAKGGSRLASVVLAGGALPFGLLAYRALRLFLELRRQPADASARLEVALVAAALGAAFLACLAASRARPALRVNLALALASLTGTLYAFEAWHALDDRIARRMDEKLELLASLEREGKRPYGGIEPSRFIMTSVEGMPVSLSIDGRDVLPLAGISRRLTVDCKEVDEQPWLVFVSDEHGFNNPPGLWTGTPVELAAVGDSFTAGSCVPPDRNMVARLRQRYPSALNLAMAGSGPLLMLAELREFAPAARPRRVIWFHFGGNDLRDLRKERRHPILVRYLEDGFRQGLIEQQVALDAALEAYDADWLSKRVARLASHSVSAGDIFTLRATRARLGLGFSDPFTFAPTEEEFELFGRILVTARRTVGGWNGELHFAYLPAWSGPPRQIGARAVAGLEAQTRGRVLSIARAAGLPIIDVAPAFGEHPDPESLFACPGCHYSAAGYQFAADVVLAALEAASPGTPQAANVTSGSLGSETSRPGSASSP
jgi:lysophospholipase L1-like esterase